MLVVFAVGGKTHSFCEREDVKHSKKSDKTIKILPLMIDGAKTTTEARGGCSRFPTFLQVYTIVFAALDLKLKMLRAASVKIQSVCRELVHVLTKGHLKC